MRTAETEKIPVSTELLYILGLAVVCLGSALMIRADLGVETVVAPAYLMYLYLQDKVPFLTFGMTSLCYSGCLILLLVVITRRFRVSYLFSFAASLVTSSFLDLWNALLSRLVWEGPAARLTLLGLGILACAVGIALCLYGYFTPGPYEFFVKALSQHFGWAIPRVKTAFDAVSCILGIGLSFRFFGFGVFRGVSVGTAVCALVTGTLVGWIRNYVDSRFLLKDLFRLRKFFEN